MKREIAVPLPAVRFPEAGWRERIASYVKDAERGGLELAVELRGTPEPPLAAVEERLGGRFPDELRALLLAAAGGRIGHLDLVPIERLNEVTAQLREEPSSAERPLLADVPRGELIAFALDFAGNPYAYRVTGPHRVLYACHDPYGWEHRLTTLATFLDSALVRAWAEAAHRKAEVEAGDDLDDGPWIAAARSAELRIDPKMQRTRED